MVIINKCQEIGRLVKDSELQYTKGGTAILNITLAIDRKLKNKDTGKRECDYIPVTIWGKQAEATASYCGQKGNKLSVCGRIETRNYIAKDGTKKYITEIQAEEVEFLNGKGPSSFNESNNTNTSSNDNGYSNVDDGETPF